MSVFFPCFNEKDKVVVRNRRGSSVITVKQSPTPYGVKETIEDIDLRNRIYSVVFNLPYGSTQTNYVDVTYVNQSDNIRRGKRILYISPTFELVIE